MDACMGNTDNAETEDIYLIENGTAYLETGPSESTSGINEIIDEVETNDGLEGAALVRQSRSTRFKGSFNEKIQRKSLNCDSPLDNSLQTDAESRDVKKKGRTRKVRGNSMTPSNGVRAKRKSSVLSLPSGENVNFTDRKRPRLNPISPMKDISNSNQSSSSEDEEDSGKPAGKIPNVHELIGELPAENESVFRYPWEPRARSSVPDTVVAMRTVGDSREYLLTWDSGDTEWMWCV